MKNVTTVTQKDSDELNAMFANLGLADDVITNSDEIVESAMPGDLEMEPAIPHHADSDLEKDVVMSLETNEAIEKHYEDANDSSVAVGDIPQQPAEVAAKPAKKARVKVDPAIKAAERAAKKAAKDAEKAAKPARKFYASKVERVTDKLGASLGDNTVLTLSDAALTGSDLVAKQQETLDIIAKAGVKVQNRMTLLLEFVGGKSSTLNEVIGRAFKLLKKDGHIKSGEKGNFHQDLLAKPYSPAAARAMGNNTIATLRAFSVIVKSADGNYVANPESLILMKANALLGLS